MGGRYYTRATKLAGLVEIAAERGADINVLMRAAGLDAAVLRSPESAIDYGDFCELLRRCSVAWDLPDIGLRMIRYQQIDFLGPVALVTRMERTVRAALQAIIANLVIHANATVAAFEEEGDGDTASLILNQRDDAPKSRENTELVMAQGKLVIDTLAGAPVALVEVAFVHDKGSSSRAVAAHFSCPIRYGAERNALTFDRALLDRRIEKTDAAYHALIKKYLATARAEVEGGTLEDARAEIARQMELGHCTLEHVADQPADAAAQPAAAAAGGGAELPRPAGRVAPGAGAVAGYQHQAAAVGSVRCARVFRAERVHPGIPALVWRNAAPVPDAATGGRRLRMRAGRSCVPLAAGHLGEEVLHLFEPGHRRHPGA